MRSKEYPYLIHKNKLTICDMAKRPKQKLEDWEENAFMASMGNTYPKTTNQSSNTQQPCSTCGCTGGGGWIKRDIGFDEPCPTCNFQTKI